MIYLNIENQTIKCLVDTGSTTSIIRPGILNNFHAISLEKPVFYSTISGINRVTNKIVTPIPKEFNTIGTFSWKVVDLKGRNYDAIIGQNALTPLKAKINLDHRYLEIKGNKIVFVDNNYPFDIHNIYTLQQVGSQSFDNINLDHINSEERKEIVQLLRDYKELFYKDGDQLTFTHEINHEIITNTSNPVYSKIYRYPKVHELEINRQINEMLEQGIITESNSPYNSPLWIVPKKKDASGQPKWRIVIDYRKLNEVTVSDKFPIPNIEGILDKLGKSQYFSTLDLAKGFHQILVKPEDRKNSFFHTPRSFRICKNAIRAEKCPLDLPTINEFDSKRVHK